MTGRPGTALLPPASPRSPRRLTVQPIHAVHTQTAGPAQEQPFGKPAKHTEAEPGSRATSQLWAGTGLQARKLQVRAPSQGLHSNLSPETL